MTDREYLFLTHGALRYALPMDEVEAVLTNNVYALVPCALPRFWGVCHRAGQLYPVVSLAPGGAGAPVGVLCRQDGAAAVFFADRVEGMGLLPETDREEAPGVGQSLREDTQTLWLPRLAELMAGGVEWT